MIWDGLIGQLPAKTYLRTTLNFSRLAHGYLFSGPVGVGKRSTAYAFAQAALCPVPAAPDTPCGACKSCRWFAARNGAQIEHPDVVPLLTFPKGRGADGRSAAAEKRVADQDPVIRLETIQYVCEQLHRSPMAGARRVVIIPEAQRLCRGQAEAANAFLKTLEEPPAASLIILTSSQPEALLETIISRVQTVQFKRLSSAEVAAGIHARWPAMEAGDLKLTAALADGSIGRAQDLVGGDLKIWRAAVLAGLEKFNAATFLIFGAGLWKLADSEGNRLFQHEKEMQTDDDDTSPADEDESNPQADDSAAKTAAGWKRHVFTRLLGLCELCFRDGLVSAASGPHSGAPLLQPDRPDFAHALGAKFGIEGCEKSLNALREALYAARLYVRGDVVARALAGRLKDALVRQ